ncbi:MULTISPECIES: winged helix-turn-helix domain-containing protein [Pseudoalteromonas]|uniref:DNA-binding winged-HTH domain protein n=1 Tax=Pseudoalteromonas luteoviolacea (strain 2ta16) TaxID=1353533 RepID=V4J8L1_PSEL2|nr:MULTISPECIES: winged helix-turn-helix domain-containing protein [Pseudoalteromonas]ESP91572.1 DNA-binding winged-HTH domain protein [Pseudoalteromonas luteoviolacea 2ta16]KZN39186.1 hypothetical protein N483_19395 [Pseudoalteromonas luteoviolacea NCIMB 1944]MCG7551097.1 winged helix-turn-helix domain-containing protein [Pseudoalteromonas sp. Of7M-16]
MNEVRFSRQVKEVKFGEWVLDPKRQCISDGDTTRELEPLLFRLLCYLIINNEQIITRQDLVDDVWNQNFVDDNAINRAMSELRKILKSDKQRGIVVKTHYRKGYSFFLEPQIIYHPDQPSNTSPESNPDRTITNPLDAITREIPEQPKAQRGKRLSWLLAGAAVLGAVTLASLDVVQFNLDYANKDESVLQTLDQPIKESVLSWVQGRYTLLNLSPNDAMVAYSFIQRDTDYYSLVVKSLKSGHERRLGEQGVNYYPVGWSADSSTIYYRIVDGDKCQVWQLSADFVSGNQFLFDCKLNSMTGGGINQDRLVYAKSGYRNRDELSALTNRDLLTGEEFQITSPNLNSYGDRFLAYVPEKEIILFERRQYDINELYMTDPDGGNQVKLHESQSRIWTLNYDDKSGQLVWFDNSKNIVYSFSLDEQRLVKAQKLMTEQSYANYETLNSRELLMTSYPFVMDIYTLDIQDKVLSPQIKSIREDAAAIEVPNGYVFLTRIGHLYRINFKANDGQVSALGLPDADYKTIRYNRAADELLIHYANKIEVYTLDGLTLKLAKPVNGTIVSVEYWSESEISYTVVDETKVNSKAYVLSSLDEKVRELPTQSTLWLDKINDTMLVTLSSNDILSAFDLRTGEVIHNLELPPAKYKHSVTILNGHIYHSDGESIHKIDFATESIIEPIYTVDDAKFVIDRVRSSDSGSLIVDMIEVVENQLLKVSLLETDTAI